VHAALTFLAVRTLRNSARTRLGRLRQPRYFFVALFGVLYFAGMIFNRWNSGAFTIPAGYESIARVSTGVLIAGLMALAWVVPGSGTLRFTLAEIQYLFAAPLTRRDLLTYKMARVLVGSAGMAVFVTLVAGPLEPIAALIFFAKTTAIAGLLGVHEAGVALYRQNRKDIGATTRGDWAIVAAAALIVFSAAVVARFAFAGIVEFLALLPLMIAAIGAAAVWVVRSDAAFEEEAALQAEKTKAQISRVQRTEPRLTSKRVARFSLAPHGPVETAILWKNWLSFSRTSTGRWLPGAIGAFVMLLAFLVGFGTAVDDPVAPVFGTFVASLILLLGPVYVRADLRTDLAHLALMKTWPVRGTAVVRGEILAPATLLSAAALVTIVVAGVSAPSEMLLSDGRLGLIVGATSAGCALIIAQLVIQNGIAIAFPAWVRIMPAAGSGGVEIIGQSLMALYGGWLVLILACIPPGVAATIVAFIVGGAAAPAIVFTVVLLIECYVAIELLGRLFDRIDLREVTVAE
jgi:hypothetical protein